jgi:hypothetical protein
MEDIIIEKPKVNDWIARGYSPLDTPDLVINSDWSNHLPVVEYQNGGNYDRSACGDYAITNALEMLYHRLTGREINFSDRALAKMSDTDIIKGGWLSKIFDAARNQGLLLESEWPDTNVKEDYYGVEIPQEVLDKRVKYEIYREWIPVWNKDLIFKMLNQAPLVVLCRYANGTDILNPAGNYNHFVTIFKAVKGEYWEVFDHYTTSRKKYAWDYEFGCILKPTLIIKQEKPYMKNNTLVNLVQGGGDWGLFLDGKILVGDKNDIILTFMSRNQGDIKGMVKQLTLVDWNKYEKANIKGEKI